jgi:hypothetical protein
MRLLWTTSSRSCAGLLGTLRLGVSWTAASRTMRKASAGVRRMRRLSAAGAQDARHDWSARRLDKGIAGVDSWLDGGTGADRRIRDCSHHAEGRRMIALREHAIRSLLQCQYLSKRSDGEAHRGRSRLSAHINGSSGDRGSTEQKTAESRQSQTQQAKEEDEQTHLAPSSERDVMRVDSGEYLTEQKATGRPDRRVGLICSMKETLSTEQLIRNK